MLRELAVYDLAEEHVVTPVALNLSQSTLDVIAFLGRRLQRRTRSSRVRSPRARPCGTRCCRSRFAGRCLPVDIDMAEAGFEEDLRISGIVHRRQSYVKARRIPPRSWNLK
jgi:hypothetical protein